MDLQSRDIEIPATSGRIDGYWSAPTTDRPSPLVILFMDVWGLREELFAIARRIASNGYSCIVPNLFYRHGKIRFEQRNAAGKMVSFDQLPQSQQVEMRGHSDAVTRETTREDVSAILAWCRKQGMSAGPAGSVGFCLGGRAACYAGQDFSQRLIANASLHGTWLVTDESSSPHLKNYALRGEFYCGFGELDRFGAQDVVAAFRQSVQDNAHVDYLDCLHADAHHGYSLPDRDVYDPDAAEKDWQNIFAMFERRLRPRARSF